MIVSAVMLTDIVASFSLPLQGCSTTALASSAAAGSYRSCPAKDVAVAPQRLVPRQRPGRPAFPDSFQAKPSAVIDTSGDII